MVVINNVNMAPIERSHTKDLVTLTNTEVMFSVNSYNIIKKSYVVQIQMCIMIYLKHDLELVTQVSCYLLTIMCLSKK